MPTALSAHFTLEELIATQQRGLDNTPSPEVIDNLRLLASDTLESVRNIVGPMHINSGYRSVAVNQAVGGQPTSQHCQGLAADFITTMFSLQEVARRILAQKITFDQLIAEWWTPNGGGWLHISHAPVGRLARMEALMVGKWTEGKYLQLDLAKVPR